MKRTYNKYQIFIHFILFSLILIALFSTSETSLFKKTLLIPEHNKDYFGILNILNFITNNEYKYNFLEGSIRYINDDFLNIYHFSQINFLIIKIIAILNLDIFLKYILLANIHIFLSLITLSYLLYKKNISLLSSLTILTIFFLYESFHSRYVLGHINLLNYSGLIITFYLLEKLAKNFNVRYLIYLSIANFYTLNLSEYYGFFNTLFSFFFIIIILIKNKFVVNHRIYLKIIIIGLFNLTLFLLLYSKFIFFSETNNVFQPAYNIETFQKYALKEPISYFIKINFLNFYDLIDRIDLFFNRKYLLTQYIDIYSNEIEKHGPNTIEFTYFYGVTILCLILFHRKIIIKENISIFYCFLLSYLPVFLLMLHPIYPISLISILEFFNLPFRSIVRANVLLDILILYLLIFLIENDKVKKLFKILILILIIFELSNNKPVKIYTAKSDIYFENNYLNCYLNKSKNEILEDSYFIHLLSNINKTEFKFKDVLDNKSEIINIFCTNKDTFKGVKKLIKKNNMINLYEII